MHHQSALSMIDTPYFLGTWYNLLSFSRELCPSLRTIEYCGEMVRCLMSSGPEKVYIARDRGGTAEWRVLLLLSKRASFALGSFSRKLALGHGTQIIYLIMNTSISSKSEHIEVSVWKGLNEQENSVRLGVVGRGNVTYAKYKFSGAKIGSRIVCSRHLMR